ncbi:MULTISPECIES: TetR/AcrR family transcriptional regulator [Streptosporangium]|uniref:AcrR family transcriptional regulator n=1 Tax=Streptosporangium brasiliense TaxID=47480 RepID=A0ABT9R9L2_9ACTN|nr:TetR/AcrR family transcriptional regulator [Streptosporangium brasiliense]MDP9865937.1 AcrR family transcriptional regulator [Streptosporangium brasiliense]
MSTQPELTPLTPRAAEIVTVARELLEEEGRDALTMRALADRLGIRAPSLYKHLPDKAAVEAALMERGFAEIGTALYAALQAALGSAPRGEPVDAVLRAYRRTALAHPNLYRLATSGPLPRQRLAPGLEEWAGTPFFLAAGEPYLAQALWSFAHGMVILELDGRYPDGSDLDRTWAEGAHAFTSRPAR